MWVSRLIIISLSLIVGHDHGAMIASMYSNCVKKQREYCGPKYVPRPECGRLSAHSYKAFFELRDRYSIFAIRE